MNQVEIWLSILVRKLLKRGSFTWCFSPTRLPVKAMMLRFLPLACNMTSP